MLKAYAQASELQQNIVRPLQCSCRLIEVREAVVVIGSWQVRSQANHVHDSEELANLRKP